MTSTGKTNNSAVNVGATRLRHHVDDAMLLAYAAGTLAQSASVVVATHLSLCPHCRKAVRVAETAGGVLLADVAQEKISSDALANTLDRLDESSPALQNTELQSSQSLRGAVLPQLLNPYLPERLRWRWVSPGVQFAHLLTDESGAKLGFMYATAGTEIAEHGHSGDELTLVLSGGYKDGAASFGRGDLQTTDEDIVHQPVTDRDGDCLLLVMVQGSVRPTSLLGRIFLPFTGF